jgi:hypothetical protein
MPTTPDAVAAALTGSPIDAIEPVRGSGRNSRIYRVACAGRLYALKHYPVTGGGVRHRLRVERRALELMTAYGINCVPRALAANERAGYLLLEWIDGHAVGDPTEADIHAATEFLAGVHALRTCAAAETLPLAAEACLSCRETVVQIKRRIARLRLAAADEPALAAFLAEAFEPLLTEITDWAEAGCRSTGIGFATPLTARSRSLCPSDFGFHNSLRASSGRLFFIDFDYFGWDDPVKLTCDFLLHPGMRLDDAAKQRFLTAITGVYDNDPEFSLRLPLFYPLLQLRWCVILLNEFLPERWASRVHAGANTEWAAAKRHQLDRAIEWVQSLASSFERFPYGE